MGACDVHTAYKMVNQSFMKLVEEHQSKTTNGLKTIEVETMFLLPIARLLCVTTETARRGADRASGKIPAVVSASSWSGWHMGRA